MQLFVMRQVHMSVQFLFEILLVQAELYLIS